MDNIQPFAYYDYLSNINTVNQVVSSLLDSFNGLNSIIINLCLAIKYVHSSFA